MSDFDWINDIEVKESILTHRIEDYRLTCIGACCGHTKSWVLTNIGLKYYSEGKNVLHVGFEEPVRVMTKRYIDLGATIQKNLLTSFSVSPNISMIDRVREIHNENNYDIILIDNPFILKEPINYLSRKLWQLSDELNTPIITTCNLNRDMSSQGYPFNRDIAMNCDTLISLNYHRKERKLDIRIVKDRRVFLTGVEETRYYGDNMNLYL